MKIGIILPEIEEFTPNNGGALSRWVYEIYKFFPKKNIHIVCPKSKSPVYSGFNIYRINTFYSFKKDSIKFLNIGHHLKYNFYPFVASLLLRKKQVKVLHILNRYSYVKIAKKVFPKVKVILHMQNDHLLYISKDEFEKVIKYSHIILTCSDYVKNGISTRVRTELSGNGIDKLITIYNGADKVKFKVNESYCTRAANHNILFLGRLLPEKGVLELIEGFILLVKSGNQSATLTVIGSSSLKHDENSDYIKLLQKASTGFETRINFTGLIAHDVLPEYMKGASIFVCPSTWSEPFGMVITEAMAAGLPIIASDRGGIPEIIEGAGLLIDPTDIVKFKQALELLLTDIDKAEKLSNLSYQRFQERFTWNKIYDSYIIVLNEINRG